MANIAIKVENLSKQYRLGEVGMGTISHDLNRWWHRVRGKEDPYLKIGESNDRTSKGESEYVWALQDINFDVQQGEILGIIGKNGAGKSTLLKVLSKVTAPTTGIIKAKGRIAALLEVGTGFHPELTGRENIYLNGTILGMRQAEVTRKLDEIVDFAGITRYLDTPVKRYSSGMMVRLGFAVAAHLEPEILIVDEVLAVGDAEFQKKAIGKMQEVSQGQGRTVLFVSHNMGAVNSLCDKSVVMGDGKVVYTGSVNEAIEFYLNTGNQENAAYYKNKNPKDTDILSIEVVNAKDELTANYFFTDTITLKFKIRVEEKYRKALLGFTIKDQTERKVFTSEIVLERLIESEGCYTVQATIPANTLVPNRYTPIIALHVLNTEVISYLTDKISFEIAETGTDFFQYAGLDYGCVFVDCEWNLR